MTIRKEDAINPEVGIVADSLYIISASSREIDFWIVQEEPHH
jgi:hypothetical protein